MRSQSKRPERMSTMKMTSIHGLQILASLSAAVISACAAGPSQGASSPQAAGPSCRVTIQSWKGTAEAHVHGQRSDVQGIFGSSTAIVEQGDSVIIKGWLGDVTIGRLEGNRFVVVMWSKDFPSDPYVDGQTAFTWNGPIGPDTQAINSENCTNDELGLGGAHLIALAVQSAPGTHGKATEHGNR